MDWLFYFYFIFRFHKCKYVETSFSVWSVACMQGQKWAKVKQEKCKRKFKMNSADSLLVDTLNLSSVLDIVSFMIQLWSQHPVLKSYFISFISNLHLKNLEYSPKTSFILNSSQFAILQDEWIIYPFPVCSLSWLNTNLCVFR